MRQRHPRPARGLDGRELVQVLAEAAGVRREDRHRHQPREDAAQEGDNEVERGEEDEQDAVPRAEEGRGGGGGGW